MSNKFSFNVGAESVGIRLDKFLAQEFLKIKPEITRTKIQNFIAQKLVKNSQNLQVNDEINQPKNLTESFDEAIEDNDENQ